jgi:VWFA-related protein
MTLLPRIPRQASNLAFRTALSAAITGLAFTLAQPASAQSNPPAPANQLPAAPNLSAPATAQAAASQAPRIQSRVSIVSLDIVAADSGGHPIHGLKPSDFTLLENGKKMTPQSFEEHRADQVSPAASQPSLTLPANTFTNFTPAPDHGPINVLVMDTLNTPVEDQPVMRQQVTEYLKNLPEGTRMAIFGLNNQLLLLQSFTSDPAVLKAALNQKALSKQSQLLRTAHDSDMDQDALILAASMGGAGSTIMNLQAFQAETTSEQTTIRIQDTIQAMDELARYLSGFPGRKNLIWFSGSFPLNVAGTFPQDEGTFVQVSHTNRFGASVQTDFEDDLKVASDLLARAQVAVYPIDGRGIFTNPALKATESGSSMTNPFVQGKAAASAPGQAKAAAPGTDAMAIAKAYVKNDTTFQAQTEEEHSTMDHIADQTGGKAQYTTNDLKAAVQEAIDNGSNYYTVTYAPTDRKLDGSFHAIRVTAAQSGAHLLYRRGYFADDPQVAVHDQKLQVLGRPMHTAMLRGGPDPSQIVFRVKIDLASANETATLKDNLLDVKKVKPPYRHYTIWYAVDMRHVVFTATADGLYHGALEYETKVYDVEGNVMNTVTNVAHANLPAERYQALLKQGLYVRQDIDAPVKGEYFLRIGMHDITSDQVGAIEVPLASISPASSPIATAAPRQP